MIVGCIYLISMTVFYIVKGWNKIRYYDEIESIRYRPLYDRIPGARNRFNKLYSLIYMIGKLMIILSLVLESDVMS